MGGSRILPALLAILSTILAACNANMPPGGAGDFTPTVAQPPREAATSTSVVNVTPTSEGVATSIPGGTTVTAGSYPRTGHAADYSWVAGRVVFTTIQSGCVYIREDVAPESADATPTIGTGVTGPIVSTAVAHDVSPPLRDITPIAPGTRPTETPRGVFVPQGPGWDESKRANGEFVVVFGHLAGPTDGRVMCPGGVTYIVDKVLPNP